MTIGKLFTSCTNLDPETRVQLYKHHEMEDYYGENFDNLDFVEMTYDELICSEAIVDEFCIKALDRTGFATLVMILLEGDSL